MIGFDEEIDINLEIDLVFLSFEIHTTTCSIQTEKGHVEENMFKSSYHVFVTLFLEVFCQQRIVSYSRADIEATNYPLTLSYTNFSILQCGTLCIEDSYCTEFLFNETNKQCNAVHCVNKAGYSYQVLSPKNDQILRFRKGKK